MAKTNWSAQQSAGLYQVNRWGRGFFDIDEAGELVVQQGDSPDNQISWPISRLIQLSADHGIPAPIIFRFPAIIQKRIADLYQAFDSAKNNFQYAGDYRCVYPVKVNQNRQVIDALLHYGSSFSLGLEAGSKAELLMVIACASADTPILYNGFKDNNSVEMAMRASRAGRDITIIIEKPNEIDLIWAAAEKLKHHPKLGVRIKLASHGSGHWEHSTGLRSKFGLFVPQLLTAVKRLKQIGLLDSLHLLHFHSGSQINDILRIKASVIEATRIYCDLVRLGVPLQTIDVGGGLAVDYTGNQSTEPSSMNYSLQEYANDVVYYIKRVCDQMQTAHPEIVSESGRALVAHHSMLALPIIGSTYRDVPQYKSNSVFTSTDRSLQPLVELKATLDELNPKNLLESYHDAQQAMDMSLQLFASGMISLEHRAQAEELFWDVCRGIRQRMNLLDFVPRELDELRKLFAETYIGNFSLFQSLRDHWAIGQLFPILPLSGLNERPTMDAVLGDITCDSDGKVNRFVGDKQTRETLPVHHLDDNRPYYLGVFLIGAYQEAIGDRHNLLGQINVVAVDADPAQSGCQPKIIDVRKGDSIASVLAANDQNTDQMLGQIAAMLEKLDSGSEDLAFFQDAFAQYSYLQAQQNENSSAAPLDETLSAPQNSEGSFVSKILNHSAHFKNKTTREKI